MLKALNEKKTVLIPLEISHILILPSSTASLIEKQISEQQWSEENGTANDEVVADNKYRVWRPTITNSINNGATLNFKIDHLKWDTDDMATIYMSFDNEGVLETTDVTFKMAGSDNLLTNALNARDDFAQQLGDAIADPKGKAAALTLAMLGKMQTAIVNSLTDATRNGGSELFPGFVNRQMLNMADLAMTAVNK